MSPRFASFNAISRLLLATSLVLSTAAFSQTAKEAITAAQRQTMSENHKKMAEMHAKMAACIEANKTPSQCHQEMMDTCAASFGGSCPMMGRGKMGGGKGMGMMGNGTCMDWMMPSESGSTGTTKSKPAK